MHQSKDREHLALERMLFFSDAVFAISIMGYFAALWQMSIWYRRAWITTIKATVDGLIYALLTAVTFGWL
jgi:hypothetical protein